MDDATVDTTQVVDVVLDPKDPMACARQIVAEKFTTNGLRTLWRYRGTFWSWTGSYYQLINDETLRAHVWEFLEKAQKLTARGAMVPFKPKRVQVGEICDAMTAVCQLDEHLEAPAWLAIGADNKSPAIEFFSCANGLLHLPTGKLHPPTPDYFGLTYDRRAAKPEQWHNFLEQLFEQDREAVATLQEWFGYTLSPDTSQQKIFGVRWSKTQRQRDDCAYLD